MSRKFEILLASIFGANILLNILVEDWVPVMAWVCALMAQLRVLSLIDND
jgi:hypothetical protein